MEIEKEDFFEVIIIGGGTCGLAMAARLCEQYPASFYTDDEHQRFHWLKQRNYYTEKVNLGEKAKQNHFDSSEILVIDSTAERFMGQWQRQFENCKIPYLRSPMFFHPDPANVDGLVAFAEKEKIENLKDLLKIENVVGKEYSKHKVKTALKKYNKHRTENKTHNQPGLIDVNYRDANDYYRPSAKVFQAFCEDIVSRYKLQDRICKDEVVDIKFKEICLYEEQTQGNGFILKTKSGRKLGCKVCILATGHNGEINYPLKPFTSSRHFHETTCHTSHLFAGNVSVPLDIIKNRISQKLDNKTLVISGGQTGAQIVDSLIMEGANKVCMIMRDKLKVKHFDFQLDWVTKYRNVKKAEFYQLYSDEERLEMINEARGGGSVIPDYYRKLKKHEKSGKLQIITQTDIKEALWKDDNHTWDIKLGSSKMEENQLTEISDHKSLLDVNYIYFATGVCQNIESLDCLRDIIENYKIPTVGGYPCITDNLQWNNEIPLFLLGKNAALRIGPSSPNLDGARIGAERIGWYVQSMKEKGKLNWFSDSTSSPSEFSVDDKANSNLASNFTGPFQTRLRLASGEISWYSLLESE